MRVISDPKELRKLLSGGGSRSSKKTPGRPHLSGARSFLTLLGAVGLPAPLEEFEFCKHRGRKFRFDYCWPHQSTWAAYPPIPYRIGTALEINGGAWFGIGGNKKHPGRHAAGVGYLQDQLKLNYANLDGWLMLSTTPDQLCSQETLDMLREAFKKTGVMP